MSLRPVDMQVLLPRVAEIYHAKMNVIHREDIDNSNALNSVFKDAEMKRSSVNQSNKSEKMSLTLDKKEKNYNDNNDDENEEKRQGEDEVFYAEDEDGNKIALKHIDLKI